MKDFLIFDRKFEMHIRMYFYMFSLLGIIGNGLDLITFKIDWIGIVYIFNISVIAILIINSVLFYFRKYPLKTAYIITLYTLLTNIIISNYSNFLIDPNSSVILLREALYVCFLITAAYLFIHETHGIITGAVFISYFTYAAIRSNNDFLISNLPSIFILYVAYILILNYFYRLLRNSVNKIRTDNSTIKDQNDELSAINNELTETQRQISVQHEELLTLSESISDQNTILETQNNELEKAVQQKNKLFSIIAHDVKSPLYSITSLTEVMLDKFDQLKDEKKKLYLQKMIESNKSLQTLLENLLTWSRSQSGLVEMQPEKISLSQTVSKILEIYKNNAAEKKLQLVYDIDPNSYIIADRMMIETILRNLISNAIKYSFDEGIISIGAIEQKSFIQFSVQDNGIGVSEEKISKLFSYSNNTITLGTKGEKGTGLGLSICKEFIEKHHGKIWIESEINKGAIIYFTIPQVSEKIMKARV